MNPLHEAIREQYRKYGQASRFESDWRGLLQTGKVIDRDGIFLGYRGVNRYAPEDDIIDPWVYFNPEVWNCWHLHWFAGDPKLGFTFEPYPLSWMSYQRRGSLQIRSYKRMKQKLQ